MPNRQIKQKGAISIFLHVTLLENLSNKQPNGPPASAPPPAPVMGIASSWGQSPTQTDPPARWLQVYGCVPFCYMLTG